MNLVQIYAEEQEEVMIATEIWTTASLEAPVDRLPLIRQDRRQPPTPSQPNLRTSTLSSAIGYQRCLIKVDLQRH